MRISTLSATIVHDKLIDAVRWASASYFSENIVVKDIRILTSHRATLTVRAVSSSGPGARRTRHNRRSVHACWHAYRDVIREVFRKYPDAQITTGLTCYRSPQHFEAVHHHTANMNIGSPLDVIPIVSLCECRHQGQPLPVNRIVGTRDFLASEYEEFGYAIQCSLCKYRSRLVRLVMRTNKLQAVCIRCGDNVNTTPPLSRFRRGDIVTHVQLKFTGTVTDTIDHEKIAVTEADGYRGDWMAEKFVPATQEERGKFEDLRAKLQQENPNPLVKG